MSMQARLLDVQKLVEANANGDAFAHRQILEAVHKLQLAAETPFDTAMRQRWQPVQNIAVLITLEYGIMQALAERKGESVNSTELSEATRVDRLLLERLMRMITWMGYADEVSENNYTANETTAHVCTPGMTGAEKHHTELFCTIGGKVVSLMRTQGLEQFPEDGRKDPFEHAFGCTLWEFFASSEEHKDAFDQYMAARRASSQEQWFEIFPVTARLRDHPVKPEQILLVDVGGGYGHEIANFHNRHPDLSGKLVLQDLPRTLRDAKLPKAVEVMPLDFFESQPVKGARFYYLRNIMHDWMDSKCKIILAHLVAAMDQDSRLLIDDYVLPPTHAEFRAIHMDIAMMLYCRAIERTRTQWEVLLDSAGLEIVEIFSPDNGYESVIEAKVKAVA